MGKLSVLKSAIPTLTGRTIAIPPKQADQVYRTPDHVAWSAEVRRRAGYACQRCGTRGVRLFADHVIEIKDGGSASDLANGQALCGACHTRKTNDEKRKRIAPMRYIPTV